MNPKAWFVLVGKRKNQGSPGFYKESENNKNQVRSQVSGILRFKNIQEDHKLKK